MKIDFMDYLMGILFVMFEWVHVKIIVEVIYCAWLVINLGRN